jgi:hypothetical protein
MRRPLVLFLALGAAACGGERPSPSPVSPTPVAAIPQIANYGGAWQVTYHVDSCIGRYCFTRISKDATLELRLVQLGDTVSGLMIAAGGNGDVEGRVAPDGTLTLTGVTPRPIPLLSWSTFDLKRFEVKPDPERGLTGTVSYEARLDGDYSGYSTGANGPVISAERLSMLSQSFAGVWSGAYQTTSCVPGPFCFIDSWGDVELALDEHGGAISGTIKAPGLMAPMTGAAQGLTAELSPDGSSGHAGRVSLSRDVLGRLTGRLSLQASRWTVEAELRRLIRIRRPDER